MEESEKISTKKTLYDHRISIKLLLFNKERTQVDRTGLCIAFEFEAMFIMIRLTC